MRYEIRDFGAPFSAPEMLGFSRTFFCKVSGYNFGATVLQSDSWHLRYISAGPKSDFILVVWVTISVVPKLKV
jgi:hypothetical protein